MQSLALVLLPALVAAYPPRYGDPFNPIGSWHRRGPPCGLPPFLEKLPVELQDRIRAVWADYKEGADCDSEHQKTREIIHELPDEERDKVFAHRCGPSFLRDVSSTVRREFRAVWFDHRLSLELKELALKKLAYSLLTGESLALFNKWNEELQVRKIELNRKIEALSPAAKEAYENWKQIRLQERAFLSSLPKSIREELKELCGHHYWKKATTTTTSTTTTTVPEETTTELATTTTTEEPSTTTTIAVETTTVVETAEEREKKEKEFALFLDVTMPSDFAGQGECAIYA